MPQHDPPPRRSARGPSSDPLGDPVYAPLAWGRFKRVLKWMALLSTALAAGAVALLRHMNGPLPVHMAIATFLGVGCTILMAATLMGLIFLSSGSGHDEAVERFDD